MSPISIPAIPLGLWLLAVEILAIWAIWARRHMIRQDSLIRSLRAANAEKDAAIAALLADAKRAQIQTGTAVVWPVALSPTSRMH